jgi:Organic solute transporter Ostalpha
MYCVIQFYVQLRLDLAPHRPFLKVAAIKLVIFLSFWQSFLISILTSSTFNVVKTSTALAYPDIKIGIPALLICIEMAFFAILHLFAFPWAPYRTGAEATGYPLSPSGSFNKPGVKQGGFLGLKALGDAMNPWDLVKGFARGMRWLFVGVKKREDDPSYKASSENDLTLESTGGDPGYKKTYTGGSPNLPIAEEFRRSKFGLPGFDKVEDEQQAGLIAHAQPNPLNPGSGGYVPARQRYDANGQDISHGGVYSEQPSPDRLIGSNPTPGTIRRQEQAGDIGMAVSAPQNQEPSPYQSHFREAQSILVNEPSTPTAADAYREQLRQARRQDRNPNQQLNNTSQPPPNQAAQPEIHNALWGQQQRPNKF